MAWIVSVADFLDPARGFDPTPAERALIDACREGQPCILGDGTLPEAESPGRRVRADLLRLLILGGTPGCGLHEAGVALAGAWVAGQLDLRAASARGQTMLVLCRFEEEPFLAQARLEHLDLAGSKLPGLFAQDARIGGSLILRGAIVTGTVDVNGAEIGGQLDCSEATLNGGERGALFGQGMRLGQSLFLRKAKVTGTVEVNRAEIGGDLVLAEADVTGAVLVFGARIDGQLDCTAATLTGSRGGALIAQGMTLGQSLVLAKARVNGTVVLSGARIDGQLACEGAMLAAGGGRALFAQGMKLGQDLILRRAKVTGTVDVAGAEIGGQMVCHGADLTGGRSGAILAQGVEVRRDFVFRELVQVQGGVNLVSAHAGDLYDDMDSWAKVTGPVMLDGFTYERILGTTDARERLGWLARAAGGGGAFYPQPYTRLAKALAAMGHARGAREVLLERERLLARHGRARALAVPPWAKGAEDRALNHLLWQSLLNPLRWLRDALVGLVVGYGYFPARSVIVLLVLWLGTTALAQLAWEAGDFAPTSDVVQTSAGWQAIRAGAGNAAAAWSAPGAPGQDWETFNRYGWAADLLIPLVGLGQTAAWAPTTAGGPWGRLLWWARWPLVVAGWVVVALVAAAVTGILQKDRD